MRLRNCLHYKKKRGGKGDIRKGKEREKKTLLRMLACWCSLSELYQDYYHIMIRE